MGTKLGREVGDGHEKHLAKTKFENSNRLPWKWENSLTAQILDWLRLICNDIIYSPIAIFLQKISEIYLTVSEIGP